jgi:hypothetical protein
MYVESTNNSITSAYLIEHLCGDIQRLIEFQPMPTTTAELGAALFMVWDQYRKVI